MSAVATVRPVPATQPDAPAPRKRRKRAPAAGANDDCWTCSSRGFKCDRRRPYCSRCLEDGKDCSGYKTQLTWGVGVASRGKLRGLSLPVAGTKRASPATTAPPPKRGHRPSASVSSIATQDPAPPLAISIPSPESSRSNVSAQREKHSTSPPLTSPFPPTWETPAYMPQSAPPYQNGFAFNDHTPLSPLAFSFPPSGAPLTSPVEHPFQHSYHHGEPFPPSRQQLSPPIPEPPSYTRPSPLSIPIPQPQMLQTYPPFTPFDTAFEHLPPFQGSSFQQADESYVRNDSHIVADTYSTLLEPDHQALQFQPDATTDADIEEIARPEVSARVGNDLSVWINPAPFSSSPLNFGLSLHSFSGGSSIGKTPRLQFLINYYSEVISPVIVAFDGPNNPYRNHVLRLAADSDALQHAIAALAASNLRQRRESGVLSTCKTAPARRSSMAHLTLTEAWHDEFMSPLDQAREETSLKNLAVQSLNRQLADPVERKKDSTLAILLMLSLFHTCATGVAKFKTQFAGVRKLLALRAAANEPVSSESKFFLTMFAWFDAITASVNDREGQFLSHHLDLSILVDSSWSLENLAGCDGSLFRVIANLARLNTLAQGKPVEENPALVSRPMPPLPPALLINNQPIDNDYSSFDGNGWYTDPGDESFSDLPKQGPFAQFWREWQEVRHSLQSWTLPPPSPSSGLTTEQRIDLANISECFRYSALVYTERLANPAAPCTSSGIQRWVQRSLHYIRRVKSDVYLLWPLFVTGAECVGAEERKTVRSRCQDIQKDSGFVNNASCLELLEAVWRQMDQHGGQGARGQGFRFTDIMKRTDDQGEYIVV